MCTLFAANMRDAGVLRIDHVMGLARQFLVPDGAGAAEGAYLRYPFDGLAAALRQESQRARCMVIGEDLGTVQDELREALARSHVLSYRVLWFERDGAKFRAPRSWPVLAAACVSTHDLPPVAAWWSGADIVEQAALGRVSSSEAAAGVAQRDRDRLALAQVVAAEGDATLATGEATPDDIVVALHEHAARAPSVLLLVQADDLAGAVTSVNVPGTDRERPNWRYRLPVTVDGLFATAIARRLLPVLRAVRGTSSDA